MIFKFHDIFLQSSPYFLGVSQVLLPSLCSWDLIRSPLFILHTLSRCQSLPSPPTYQQLKSSPTPNSNLTPNIQPAVHATSNRHQFPLLLQPMPPLPRPSFCLRPDCQPSSSPSFLTIAQLYSGLPSHLFSNIPFTSGPLTRTAAQNNRF